MSYKENEHGSWDVFWLGEPIARVGSEVEAEAVFNAWFQEEKRSSVQNCLSPESKQELVSAFTDVMCFGVGRVRIDPDGSMKRLNPCDVEVLDSSKDAGE